MLDQFQPWYFGVAFAFVFKYCTGMPDVLAFAEKQRHRRTADAPRIELAQWVRVMARRVEAQVSRDWLFGFATWNLLFRTTINFSRTIYSYEGPVKGERTGLSCQGAGGGGHQPPQSPVWHLRRRGRDAQDRQGRHDEGSVRGGTQRRGQTFATEHRAHVTQDTGHPGDAAAHSLRHARQQGALRRAHHRDVLPGRGAQRPHATVVPDAPGSTPSSSATTTLWGSSSAGADHPVSRKTSETTCTWLCQSTT